MKIFLQREILAAYLHAKNGGQALHLCSTRFAGPSAPQVFKTGDQFAHLFDQDLERLIRTARKFGVRKIVPQHVGTERQHIDLCRGPLDRAVDRANMDAAPAGASIAPVLSQSVDTRTSCAQSAHS